jgi:hypothetical protein
MSAALLLAVLLAAVAPASSPADSASAAQAVPVAAAPAPPVADGPDSAARVARSPLAALAFLVGEWSARGTGTPGVSAGSFSFEWSAGARALVRHNRSATPTGQHEDVMLVHPGANGHPRAVYVDSEGHVIEYAVTSGPGRVVFESAGPGPRYRLTDRLGPDSTLWNAFEIAPPGGTFRTDLEGTARRGR